MGPSPATWIALFEPQPHGHETRHRPIHIKGLAALGALGESILASVSRTFTGNICNHGSDKGQPWVAVQAKDTMNGWKEKILQPC